MTVYCPVDDKSFDSMADLKEHLKKAQTEGDELHMDIIDLEGWDENVKVVPSEKWSGDQVKEESDN